LDLLRIEDAKKVQQRLIALKYLTGPADGLWTSRSRSAVREFKVGNGLPHDDLFDGSTEIAVFSPSAVKNASMAINGNKPKEAQEAEGKYPPPAGAFLNPLNVSDATALQKRLSQLGFFKGRPNGVWGVASRTALRDFKAVNNLVADDQWDGNTEQALLGDGVLRASDTFIGGWGEDQGDCGPTHPGRARLRISTRQAEIEDVTCKFVTITRDGSGWRVAAECAKPGKKWSSDVKIEASASRLTWTSNGETNAYMRCK
jgi:Putative peptidoglycan binding domain